MEASSESLTLSRIPDRVTQMFRLAQDELQLNRSYFAQLISSRCAKLDKIRQQRETLTKKISACQLSKPEIIGLNKILQDIANVKSDIRTKQRNNKMLKERLAEVLAKRHQLVVQRGEYQKQSVKARMKAKSLEKLERKAMDIRQVSMGKMLIGTGSTAKFSSKEA